MAFYFGNDEGYSPLGEGATELSAGTNLYEKWGDEDSGGFNQLDPRILQDSNIRYGEPGSLEYILAKLGGLAGNDFSSPGAVAGMLRNSGAPGDYDWSGAVGKTWGDQQAQFGKWSGADDPGQTANKILGNVSDPWATQARLSLLSSPEFGQSQRTGEAAVNYDPDAGNIFGIPKPIVMAALAAGGAQMFGGGFGGAESFASGSFDPMGAVLTQPGIGGAATGVGGGGVASDALWAATGNFDPMGAVLTSAGGGASGGGGILQQVLNGLKIPGIGNLGEGASALSKIYNIGSGIYGLTQANDMKKLSQQIMERSDPFAASRPQYAAQLNALMADPSQIVNAPGYRAGEQAVMRKLGSQGYLGSGNMMLAMRDFGGNMFDTQVARLAQLAGANVAPGSGMGTAANVRSGSASATQQALSRIGYGLAGGL